MDWMNLPITCGKWEKRFAFLPHKCHVSGKLIWFKFGYKMNTYVFFRQSRNYWRDQQVHVIQLLKGNDFPIKPFNRPPPPPPPPMSPAWNKGMNRIKNETG